MPGEKGELWLSNRLGTDGQRLECQPRTSSIILLKATQSSWRCCFLLLHSTKIVPNASKLPTLKCELTSLRNSKSSSLKSGHFETRVLPLQNRELSGCFSLPPSDFPWFKYFFFSKLPEVMTLATLIAPLSDRSSGCESCLVWILFS